MQTLTRHAKVYECDDSCAQPPPTVASAALRVRQPITLAQLQQAFKPIASHIITLDLGHGQTATVLPDLFTTMQRGVLLSMYDGDYVQHDDIHDFDARRYTYRLVRVDDDGQPTVEIPLQPATFRVLHDADLIEPDWWRTPPNSGIIRYILTDKGYMLAEWYDARYRNSKQLMWQR